MGPADIVKRGEIGWLFHPTDGGPLGTVLEHVIRGTVKIPDACTRCASAAQYEEGMGQQFAGLAEYHESLRPLATATG